MDKQMGKKRTSYRIRYRENKRRISNRILWLGIVIFGILYIYAFVKAAGIDNVRLTGMKKVVRHVGEENGRINHTEGELKEVQVNSLFTAQDHGYCLIHCDTAMGIQEIPLEDFLVLALGANIDMQYDMETLKAQAVLLRGNCLKVADEQVQEAMNEKGGTISDNKIEVSVGNEAASSQTIDSAKLDFPYYSLEELKLIWCKNYDTYYQKAKEAVNQTQGIYAKSGSEILKGNFHAMSAGKTRSGKEVLGDVAFDYLQSVPCNKNVENENFLQTKYFEKSETSQLQILERDSAGYVTKVSWNGQSYSGEQLRDALGLASANFEIENGEHYSITTKGIGHGFGFDQYYANYMAQEMGMDYMNLISYFYKDVSFSVQKRK